MAQAAAEVGGRRFVRKHLRELDAYQPIEPFDVLSQRLGRPPSSIVKLDANENPYGPPPEVHSALASLNFPHVYPDPECRQLRAALADDSSVPQQNIIAGAGADELIDLIFRTCVEIGEPVINTPPTFGMYKFDADINGASIVNVHRSPSQSFRLDIDSVVSSIYSHNAKLVFLASPNNPDGGIISDADLTHLLSEQPNCLVVLDEAYIEFSNTPSRMSWCLRYDNLIVLRTFSKRAALAGMRIGYAAVPSSLMEFLWRAKQPYNVSVAAEAAALASLSNPSHQAYTPPLISLLFLQPHSLHPYACVPWNNAARCTRSLWTSVKDYSCDYGTKLSMCTLCQAMPTLCCVK
jgi:histidinol-phosphate aminotransferase